jgi:hypothetical protein
MHPSIEKQHNTSWTEQYSTPIHNPRAPTGDQCTDRQVSLKTQMAHGIAKCASSPSPTVHSSTELVHQSPSPSSSNFDEGCICTRVCSCVHIYTDARTHTHT